MTDQSSYGRGCGAGIGSRVSPLLLYFFSLLLYLCSLILFSLWCSVDFSLVFYSFLFVPRSFSIYFTFLSLSRFRLLSVCIFCHFLFLSLCSPFAFLLLPLWPLLFFSMCFDCSLFASFVYVLLSCWFPLGVSASVILYFCPFALPLPFYCFPSIVFSTCLYCSLFVSIVYVLLSR